MAIRKQCRVGQGRKPDAKVPHLIPGMGRGGGGSLLSGGMPGNRGRPSDKFLQTCRELADSPESIHRLQEMLNDPNLDHDMWLKVWRVLAERGYGRPHVQIDFTNSTNADADKAAAIAQQYLEANDGEPDDDE